MADAKFQDFILILIWLSQMVLLIRLMLQLQYIWLLVPNLDAISVIDDDANLVVAVFIIDVVANLDVAVFIDAIAA